MISRSGLTLRTYPRDHRHRVLDLPSPRLGAYQGREDFVRRLRDEWERACATVAREHPDVSPAVVTERVAKSWEPHLPAIMADLPAADLRALLDGYGSLLAVLRVGVMPYTAEIVDAAMGGQITVTTGKVEGIHRTEADTLVVSVSGQQRIEADLVISNFGRESNYERANSTLWANLLRKGVARVHRRTGRGVEVDGHGNLLGRAGEPSGPVSAVGSPREGDEIVRNGRTGAFTFNLAAIKNHSVEVAASVLCRLETCYDDTAAPSIDASDPELDRAILLDVHRMTARRRDHRQALTARLDDSIQTIRDRAIHRGGIPATKRGLRFAITTVAAAKLKDLSVTPRDLRTILGLERLRNRA